jgi:hypothetical protein
MSSKHNFLMGAVFSTSSETMAAAAALVGTKVPDFEIHPVGSGESTTLHALLAKEGKPIVLDIYAEW